MVTSEWGLVLSEYRPKAIQKNPNTYSAKFNWKINNKLALPTGTRREIASAYYQLKFGHGYNRDYLSRIGKLDSPLCSCGARQTPEHILLSCKWTREDRKILKKEMKDKPLTLCMLLHTKIGIKATLAFIERTKVGTRKWHLGQTDD